MIPTSLFLLASLIFYTVLSRPINYDDTDRSSQSLDALKPPYQVPKNAEDVREVPAYWFMNKSRRLVCDDEYRHGPDVLDRVMKYANGDACGQVSAMLKQCQLHIAQPPSLSYDNLKQRYETKGRKMGEWEGEEVPTMDERSRMSDLFHF